MTKNFINKKTEDRRFLQLGDKETNKYNAKCCIVITKSQGETSKISSRIPQQQLH